MRTACRAVLGAALAVLTILPATAQQRPNGLLMDSVDPVGDSLFISKMRCRLDSVRRAEKRPTIALILSGGGAKGAAQAGALKVIEEVGLPVDLIGGTSIGGLIGGLYSIGYRSDDIHSLFITRDWQETLTDRIGHEYFTYQQKQYDSRYLISIPLVRNPESDEDKTERGMSALTRSLPEGYAFGFNINNLLSSLTASWQDGMDFCDLPIPFFCVASDMVSCKEKNWTSGSLTTAMRSTMSIPGLFDPVRTGDMVLVDGGTRNNFPVDIARAAGADYIIGIDLSDADPEYGEVSHLGNIVSRFVTMLGQPSFEKNKDESDILIKPDLDGFGMMSFKAEAVDTMYIRGIEAAEACRSSLLELKEKMNGAGAAEVDIRASDIRGKSVRIDSIRFDGLNSRESSFLLKELGLAGLSEIRTSTIEDAMSRILATGKLSTIKYSLEGAQEPYVLVFTCSRAPIHNVGMSMRADTKEAVSILFNIGLNAHKITGSKLDFTAKLGSSQSAQLIYSYESLRLPKVSIEADISNTNIIRLFTGKYENISRNDVSLWGHSERISLSSSQWHIFNINGGLRNDYYGVKSILSDEMIYAKEYLQNNFRGDYLSLYFRGSAFTMDDRYFPSRGLYFNIDTRYEFAQLSGRTKDTYRPYLIFAADLNKVFPVSSKFSIIGDFHLRSILGENSSHIGISNYVGGEMTGRYLDQQIPFVGFDDVCLCYDHVAVINAHLRYRMSRKWYAALQGGYLREQELFETDGSIDLRPSNWGTAFELSYDSALGPLKGAVRWSNRKGWGVYMSLGFDF